MEPTASGPTEWLRRWLEVALWCDRAPVLLRLRREDRLRFEATLTWELRRRRAVALAALAAMRAFAAASALALQFERTGHRQATRGNPRKAHRQR